MAEILPRKSCDNKKCVYLLGVQNILDNAKSRVFVARSVDCRIINKARRPVISHKLAVQALAGWHHS